MATFIPIPLHQNLPLQPPLVEAVPPTLADVARRADYLFKTVNYYGGAMGEVDAVPLGNAANALVETSLTSLAREGPVAGLIIAEVGQLLIEIRQTHHAIEQNHAEAQRNHAQTQQAIEQNHAEAQRNHTEAQHNHQLVTGQLDNIVQRLDTNERVLSQLLTHFRNAGELAARFRGYPRDLRDLQAGQGRGRGRGGRGH
ncbi:hypothetical protein MJO28_014755 [Puccinia striiformis f. sp. tritici]|uniref:Uncharacterized protein n=1 Tax=Puccinia striiformis f. sp. tritici TaxID=168172 RepID=A0ACC0DVP3_9BASI|nr:hypothetical protein MJO28_014755 [Puccinia striiformis f. sp. tritici]